MHEISTHLSWELRREDELFGPSHQGHLEEHVSIVKNHHICTNIITHSWLTLGSASVIESNTDSCNVGDRNILLPIRRLINTHLTHRAAASPGVDICTGIYLPFSYFRLSLLSFVAPTYLVYIK